MLAPPLLPICYFLLVIHLTPNEDSYCVLAGQTYRSRAVGGCRDQSGLLTDHCYSCGEGGEVSDLPT